jgi:hypothetical protein
MVIMMRRTNLNTNQIDSSTLLKLIGSKGDVIDFEYELNSLPITGENTIHGSNSVDGFYDREEFNNFPSKKFGVKFYVINHLTMF